MPTKYRDEARAIAGQTVNGILTPRLEQLKALVDSGKPEAARKIVLHAINLAGKRASAEIHQRYKASSEFQEKDE